MKEFIRNTQEKFSNLPVKSKLMLIILSVTVTCILITVMAFSTYGVMNIKKQMKNELAITGTIISNRINAALVFGNNSVALETLSALGANAAIQTACVYDSDGNVFAKFFAGQLSSNRCPKAAEPIMGFFDDKLIIHREVIDSFDNSIIGSLYIHSDLRRVHNYIIKQAFIAITIIFSALIVGFILARKLQNIISEPLSMLVAQDNASQYMTEGSAFFSSGNELQKLDMLMGAVFKKVQSLELEVRSKNKQLNDLQRNSEATFDYLSNELKQPLEATLAFGDIISSKSIGDIDKEYIAYYNDVYLNVFYFYGIINDTMKFYKDHLDSSKLNKVEVHPVELIEKSMEAILNDIPEYMDGISFSYNILGQEDVPMIFLDEVIANELFNNMVFVFSKYLKLLDISDMHIKIATKIDEEDPDALKFKLDITCEELIDQSIGDILENHRDYQNDVHLLRAKLQYLKYIASYNGGYLDYGDDIRCMSQMILLFPLSQVTLEANDAAIENMMFDQLGHTAQIENKS